MDTGTKIKKKDHTVIIINDLGIKHLFQSAKFLFFRLSSPKESHLTNTRPQDFGHRIPGKRRFSVSNQPASQAPLS